MHKIPILKMIDSNIPNDFKIKFSVPENEINATVLINSLINISTVIQVVNNELDSGKKIDIKVKALQKGSFLIHIELIETALESLKNIFTKENVEYAGAVIGGLVALLELKKHLGPDKGEVKSEKGNDITIQNSDGNTITVNQKIYNIYERNPTVQDALTRSFEAINSDDSITGFEITDQNEIPYFVADRTSIDRMAEKPTIEKEGQRTTTEFAILTIIRPSFEVKLKWDFYYKGNKISATMADPHFLELVDKGEKFAKGDKLEVDLSIVTEYDPTVDIFIIKGYKINKFHRHEPRSEQGRIDFGKN